MVVESVHVEAIGRHDEIHDLAPPSSPGDDGLRLGERGVESATRPLFVDGGRHDTPFVAREALVAGEPIDGPAVLVEATGTVFVAPGWQATSTHRGDLVLTRVTPLPNEAAIGTTVDPIQLEIFNNLFMNIAEQMGVVLENTASSVNIKERLDFSCAIFDPDGDLIANAPHMPVHLGSMSESIKSIIRTTRHDAGRRLRDERPLRRWHPPARHHHRQAGVRRTAAVGRSMTHARSSTSPRGGITPTSAARCPVRHRRTADRSSRRVCCSTTSRWSTADDSGTTNCVRCSEVVRIRRGTSDQNVADLQAQVAACEKGAIELLRVIDHYGLDVVHAYMGHVKDNAEESVRRVIDALTDSSFAYEMDDGHRVAVRITVDHANRSAVDRLHRYERHPPGQLQRPVGDRARRGALRVPMPRRRRHPPERRLHEAPPGRPAA